ncbi:MAG: tRNA adenosine(34) deaminase TadA [Planctomycetota bacterium]|nr:tRNA adenosine(34) deaminase TadA [Planctomycetota bacterium]
MSQLRLAQTVHPDVTEIDIAMMERAIVLASKAAAMDEVPVGAVIYRRDRIIAEAHNLREKSNDPVAHAELLAISRAGRALGEWRLSDCSLAVTLEPCPMCAGAMVNARLGRVIYGASDPKAGACRTLFTIPTDKRLNHEVQVIGGVLADRCARLLKDFFQRKRMLKSRPGRPARSA